MSFPDYGDEEETPVYSSTFPPIEIKSRIKELRHVRASELAKNGFNWRKHPNTQRSALNSVLTRIGFAGAILAREEAGKLEIIDGHLRAEEAGESFVPVLVTDLSEEEARAVLASFDSIGSMADIDTDALARLRESLNNTPYPLDSFDVSLRDVLDGFSLDEEVSAAIEEEEAGAFEGQEAKAQTLRERFGWPPFTVLDARNGDWQKRKDAWLSLGIESEVGRGENLLKFSELVNSKQMSDKKRKALLLKTLALEQKNAQGKSYAKVFGIGDKKTWDKKQRALQLREKDAAASAGRASNLAYSTQDWIKKVKGDDYTGLSASSAGTSVFDPVLTELMYRWFCKEGGQIVDPFAGGSVRGVVASRLGFKYWGCDLRSEQVAANNAQAAKICNGKKPIWKVGDALNLLPSSPMCDLAFSCPPYGDLEKYSDDPADLSTMQYDEFIKAYRAIIKKLHARVKPKGYACFTVGEFRDKKTGYYRGFVPATVQAFEDAGFKLYNEAILVTAIGSLPIRVSKQFEASRKLGKTHQNILIFIKP